MGSYHSIELAVGRKFKLEKSHWDFMAFERLKTATDVSYSTTPFNVLQFITLFVHRWARLRIWRRCFLPLAQPPSCCSRASCP